MITFPETDNCLKTGMGAGFKNSWEHFEKKTKQWKLFQKMEGTVLKKSGGNYFKKCDGSCDASRPLNFYEDYFSSLEIVLQNSAQLS